MTSKVANNELRRLLKAIRKYGLETRFNGAHYIVSAPLKTVIISQKYGYIKPRLKDLAEAGVDVERLQLLM